MKPRKKQKFQIQYNTVKNPGWQEADQLVIYKRVRGVELVATEKQLQLAVRAGFEPGTCGFQVRRPNYSTTLSPKNVCTVANGAFRLEGLLSWCILVKTAQIFDKRDSSKKEQIIISF